MDTRAGIITTMGIISDEVYNDDYFNGIKSKINVGMKEYVILDSQSTPNTDFQGLLLQEEGTNNYVVAFRGTSSFTDGLVDLVIAGNRK